MNQPTDYLNAASESSPVAVPVEVLPHAEGLPLPAYETAAAAGMDLRAAVSAPLILQPGQRHAVPTGLRVAIPPGYEAQIRPRSGLAARQGISMVNTPGTIDADYRGEILVLMINLGQEPFVVRRGERIAQMVVAPVARIAWEPGTELDETHRGAGGFGSTGRG